MREGTKPFKRGYRLPPPAHKPVTAPPHAARGSTQPEKCHQAAPRPHPCFPLDFIKMITGVRSRYLGSPFIFVSFNLSLPAFGQLLRIARGATEPRAGLRRQSGEEKPLPAKVVAGSRRAQRPNEPSARRGGGADETAGLTFSDSRDFLIRPRNKWEPRGRKARSSRPALAGAPAMKRNVRVYK